MRSVTLAEALRKKHHKIIFLINDNLFGINEIRKRKFEFKKIPNFLSKKHEVEYISKLMNSKSWKSIIIDMREYGEIISKYFMNKKLQIILLDDAWCKNAYANIIINGTTVKNYLQYKKINKKSKIFVGPKYWIINEQFQKNKKNLSDIISKKKYQVFVSVGGSDSHGLSLLILNSLLAISNIFITVIIGPFFKDEKKLRLISKNYESVRTIKSPIKIWNEFKKADIVISASGNTLFELSVQRIPTIAIVAEPHQLPYAKFFSSKGFCINLGTEDKLNSTKILNTVVSLLINHQKRKKMCVSAKKIIDGKGLIRVVKVIENSIKNS